MVIMASSCLNMKAGCARKSSTEDLVSRTGMLVFESEVPLGFFISFDILPTSGRQTNDVVKEMPCGRPDPGHVLLMLANVRWGVHMVSLNPMSGLHNKPGWLDKHPAMSWGP